MSHLEVLTRALLVPGRTLTASLRRSGARAASLREGDRQIGYGEGAHLGLALEALAESYRNGDTRAAIGGGELLSAADGLDRRILAGEVLNAYRVEGADHVLMIEARLTRVEEYRAPRDVVERVRRTHEAETHERRGITYVSAMDRDAVTTRVYANPTGRPEWEWRMTGTGCGADLARALELVLLAELKEE